MSRLTRDGTAEPVSRDQILRHARGQGNIYFPCSADHEQDWQPYPVDPYSAICEDHTYIPGTYIHAWSPTWSTSLPRIQLISPGSLSNISPIGAIFVPSLPKTGTGLLHPRPPQSLNGSTARKKGRGGKDRQGHTHEGVSGRHQIGKEQQCSGERGHNRTQKLTAKEETGEGVDILRLSS